MQCINRLALRESCEGTFRIVFNFSIRIAELQKLLSLQTNRNEDETHSIHTTFTLVFHRLHRP